MRIRLNYMSQLKTALGRTSDTAELPDGATVRALVERLVEQNRPELSELLCEPCGALRRSLVVCVGGRQVPLDHPAPLADGDEVLLLTPISGG